MHLPFTNPSLPQNEFSIFFLKLRLYIYILNLSNFFPFFPTLISIGETKEKLWKLPIANSIHYRILRNLLIVKSKHKVVANFSSHIGNERNNSFESELYEVIWNFFSIPVLSRAIFLYTYLSRRLTEHS